MPNIKRINVNKNDEPALVVEKVIDAEAESLVLNIPKFSKFSAAGANFALIKKQAEILRKKIVIESVDEAVLELATENGLEAVNPFFSKAGKKQFSDIVVKVNKKKRPIEPIEEDEIPGPEVVESILPERFREESSGEPKRFKAPKFSLPSFEFKFSKKWIWLLSLALFVGLSGYVGAVVLPRAEIVVITEKKTWAFSGEIGVDKSLAGVDTEKNRIPGQLFVQKNNITLKFPANGKKAIERKAVGTITIYNAYSSEPQQLVANTRFQTADGKIFRITSAVNVPGAQIVDGKVVPSSVEADIVADEPGAEYNIGPTPRLSIPGFAKTPKFQGFYGEIKSPTTGGFVGEAKIATEEDIAKAKSESARTLESSIRTLLASQIPADFKVLDGTAKFSITKQTIDDVGDKDGNFSIFTEGEIAAMAFQEKDILTLLVNKIKAEEELEYQVADRELIYEAVEAGDPLSGKITININYRAQLSRVIDQKSLLQNVRGQSLEGARGILKNTDGVSNQSSVSLWPVWVDKVPQNLEKIELILE